MFLASFNYQRARRDKFRNISAVREIIAIRSFPYVHSELLFTPQFCCISFSATLQDRAKGCRFKVIHYGSGYWDFVEIPISPLQELFCFYEAMRMAGFNPERNWRTEMIVNMTMHNHEYSHDGGDTSDNFLSSGKALKYGLWGLCSFGTPLKIIHPHPDRPWCSFAVARAIKAGTDLDCVPSEIHPADLHKLCRTKYDNESRNPRIILRG